MTRPTDSVPTREEIDEYVDEAYPDEEILLFDGLDSAFIGIGFQQYEGPVAVYDRELCIEALHKQFAEDGSDDPHTDALEWFGFNTEGAWLGEKTPIIVATLESYRKLMA
jgi:hypothetical protein